MRTHLAVDGARRTRLRWAGDRSARWRRNGNRNGGRLRSRRDTERLELIGATVVEFERVIGRPGLGVDVGGAVAVPSFVGLHRPKTDGVRERGALLGPFEVHGLARSGMMARSVAATARDDDASQLQRDRAGAARVRLGRRRRVGVLAELDRRPRVVLHALRPRTAA